MIPCHHDGCSHESADKAGHLDHGSLHFTASVMGNPEYLAAVKDIKQAPDQRMVGLEKLNAVHQAEHDKRQSNDDNLR